MKWASLWNEHCNDLVLFTGNTFLVGGSRMPLETVKVLTRKKIDKVILCCTNVSLTGCYLKVTQLYLL